MTDLNSFYSKLFLIEKYAIKKYIHLLITSKYKGLLDPIVTHCNEGTLTIFSFDKYLSPIIQNENRLLK